MYKVKESSLDLTVTSPFTGKDVCLRFICEVLAEKFRKYMPQHFELIEEEAQNEEPNAIRKTKRRLKRSDDVEGEE